MALEAETTEPDFEAIAARSKGGRPGLGEGVSPVLQIRLDAQTRKNLTNEQTNATRRRHRWRGKQSRPFSPALERLNS